MAAPFFVVQGACCRKIKASYVAFREALTLMRTEEARGGLGGRIPPFVSCMGLRSESVNCRIMKFNDNGTSSDTLMRSVVGIYLTRQFCRQSTPGASRGKEWRFFLGRMSVKKKILLRR